MSFFPTSFLESFAFEDGIFSSILDVDRSLAGQL